MKIPPVFFGSSIALLLFLLGSSGAFAASFPIATTAESEIVENLAFGRDVFLAPIEWESTQGATQRQVRVSLLPRTGNLPASSTLVTGSGKEPALAFDGNNFLVVYLNLSEVVFGQFVSPSGQLVGSPFQISAPGITGNDNPQVAFNGTNYLAVWTDAFDFLKGRVISPGGQLVNSVTTLTSEFVLDPRIAAGQGKFLVVAIDADTDTSIYGQVINGDGSLSGSIIQIDVNTLKSGYPVEVLFNPMDNIFVVAFSDEVASGNFDLFVRTVSVTGAVGSRQLIAGGAGNQIAPRIAFDGRQYFFTWNDGFPGASVTSRGQFFSRSLQPVGATQILFQQQGNRVPYIAPAAFDGSRILVVNSLVQPIGPDALGEFDFVNGDTFGQWITPATPGVITQPASDTVGIGQSANFSVAASGQEPVSYQWQKNGVNIPGATSREFTIPSATSGDAGTYRVVITNPYGSQTSSGATLNVLAPPTIVVQPQDQLNASGSVTLSVQATGSGPLTYQWRLNGIKLPGATSSSYTIPNLTPGLAGKYSVAVANEVAAVNSRTALVTLQGPTVPAPDNFANRAVLDPFGGFGNGNNSGKSREAGEPIHADQPGGRSVWYSWQAPQTGVATFSTAGSSFDTLLAVYTGSSIDNLTPVASDDDRGGFFTSEVRFNAVQGTTYLIAVDGLAGANGNFFLSWSQSAGGSVPEIITQPVDQAVVLGGTATFSVTARAQAALSYQWFHDGQAIAGATGPTLVRPNVSASHAGNYTVAVTAGQTVLSRSVFLEIGSAPGEVSEDKFEEVLLDEVGTVTVQTRIKSVFTPPVAGSLGTQIFENVGATKQDGEPNHCGEVGGASRWFKIRPGVGGILAIDTLGSEIDTVLAVYTGNSLTNLSLVGCDKDEAGNPRGCRVTFEASQGVNYLVAIDGVEGAEGNVQMNYQLGTLPAISQAPANQTASPGSTVQFQVVATSTPPATFQWFFNGIELTGQTNTNLVLPGVQAADAGTYRVRVTSAVGSVESSAQLTLGTSTQGPSAALTSPANGSTFAPGSSVTLNANASGNGISKVEFFQNGRKIGEDLTAPYSFVWNNIPAGSLSLTAKATDAAGRVATSTPVKVVVDNLAPTITLTAPASNAKVSNSIAQVRGTARDNGQVAQVLVQVNNGAFNPATGTTNWSTQVSLNPGTNLLTVKAVDGVGLSSASVTRKVIFVVTEPLPVTLVGSGTVTPNLNQQRLLIGKGYRMVAKPAVGFLFEGWTVGEMTTNHPTLNFVMQSNLLVTARFIPNPFIPVKGSYSGLFYDAGQAAHANAGAVNLKTTDKGAFSGSLLMGATKIPLTGQFNLTGFVRKTVNRSGKPPLTVDLWLDVSNRTDQITGLVSDGTWQSYLLAERATYQASTNPAPMLGKFTHLVTTTNTDSAIFPVGDGWATVTVDAAGKMASRGALGDGTLVANSSVISRYGQAPFYQSLYGGAGSIFGWITFSNATVYGADLLWTRPANAASPFYPQGFTDRVRMNGERYQTPSIGSSVFSWSAGKVVLEEGNLPTPLTNEVTTAGAKLVIATNDASKLALTVSPVNGSFSGSFQHPVSGKTTPIKGVVLQPSSRGGGNFQGANESGRVRIDSAAP